MVMNMIMMFDYNGNNNTHEFVKNETLINFIDKLIKKPHWFNNAYVIMSESMRKLLPDGYLSNKTNIVLCDDVVGEPIVDIVDEQTTVVYFNRFDISDVIKYIKSKSNNNPLEAVIASATYVLGTNDIYYSFKKFCTTVCIVLGDNIADISFLNELCSEFGTNQNIYYNSTECGDGHRVQLINYECRTGFDALKNLKVYQYTNTLTDIEVNI